MRPSTPSNLWIAKRAGRSETKGSSGTRSMPAGPGSGSRRACERRSDRSISSLLTLAGWSGREEQPYGAGSVGVVLFTSDGGLKWRRAGENTLPGLNYVRFVDNKTGFVLGDGSDQFSTGVFTTTDNGRTWKPVAGPRSPAWLAGAFQDGKTGVLAAPGAIWRLFVRAESCRQTWTRSGVETCVRSRWSASAVIAVGQGGLVLVSAGSSGARWSYADLLLPTEVRADWDFRAVHSVAKHVWIAGRPGSAILHSADSGEKWEVLNTGQPLPLNGIHFADELRRLGRR